MPETPKRSAEPYRYYRKRTRDYLMILTIKLPFSLWPRLKQKSRSQSPAIYLSNLVQEALLKKGRK